MGLTKLSFAFLGILVAIALPRSQVWAQHFVIRLEPANRTAEVRIDDPRGEGYTYETLFPCGSIRNGVWDIVTAKVGGPLVGLRAISKPRVQANGEITIQTLPIEIYLRHQYFPEGLVRRVPDRFLATLSEEPLELTWVTVEQREVHVGTIREDADPKTIPTFSVMCNGELRVGIWEENLTGKTIGVLGCLYPNVIEIQADGVFWFVIGGGMRRKSHGNGFSPDYQIENRNMYLYPVRLSPHAKPSSGSDSAG